MGAIMGVLACDRRGCSNIMCDRLSNTYGYICDFCFDELVDSQTRQVAEFMDTPKSRESLEIPREAYAEIFQSRRIG